MNTSFLRFGLACLAVPAAALAQTATLAPQGDRISDTVIQADHRAYEAMQGRIKTLNDGGRRVADYHLSKAQCWLDASFHEYSRNDRSAFPQAALTESEKLVAAMESRVSPLPMDTPLVNGAARLRPDLWARAESLRQAPGFACAAQRAACAEVELVHAGNEHNQQGWRHAKPYVQIAEDAIAEAEAAASRCVPPAAPAGPVATARPAPQPPAATPVPAAARVELAAELVFAFDRAGRADIRAEGRAGLDAVLRRIESERLRVVAVRLTGHADRLNGTGNAGYNRRLSQRRAETVRDLLVERGIPAGAISLVAAGDADPVAPCPRTARTKRELEACLLPNRRVAIAIGAVRQP